MFCLADLSWELPYPSYFFFLFLSLNHRANLLNEVSSREAPLEHRAHQVKLGGHRLLNWRVGGGSCCLQCQNVVYVAAPVIPVVQVTDLKKPTA